jgi:small subunit ribosomal protein S1
MSDDFTDEENNSEENFADLLESYTASKDEDIQIGDKIQGEIISIGKDTVYIDTGLKIDGVVDREELLDENMEFPYTEGDTLELYIVFYNGSEIRLSKALSGAGSPHMIREAYERAIPIEGKVKGIIKGGFDVDVLQNRAFCPISQIDLKYVEVPDEYLGQTYLFLIMELEAGGKNIVVSRRELLQREQEESRKQFFLEIDIGSELEGRVTKLMPYGAFVELLPGIEGMVHLSEMSWSKIQKAEEVLRTGDLVNVKVIGIAQGKEPGQKKISLSIKQISGDPWNTVEDQFRIGDKIKGKVTRCVKFGAFVEIAEGIEGLVHISEMSYRRVLKPEEVVSQGDSVEVMIKELDPERRRISLSMKDAEGDPWIEAPEKYSIGKSVPGIIEKKERFGFFIELEPGITGLLPKSKISSHHKPALLEKLREGDAIAVIIEEIHPDERKITLSPGDAMDEEDWRSFAQDKKKSMGSLGEKLQQALKDKK